MSYEKPLHVRVAEALGWSGFKPSANAMWPDEWRGRPPVPIVLEPPELISRYDTDWSVTGPLIERFQFMLRHFGVSRPHIAQEWIAVKIVESDPPGEQAHEADGATPLLAVCNLVLELHAAGKLHTPPPVPA